MLFWLKICFFMHLFLQELSDLDCTVYIFHFVWTLLDMNHISKWILWNLSPVSDDEKPTTSAARDSPPAKKVKVGLSLTAPSRSRSPSPRAKSPPRTPKTVGDKFSQAQPYSFFLTRVSGIADKYNSSFVMDIKGNNINNTVRGLVYP